MIKIENASAEVDYNTQRSKLIISEYGRNVQSMVDHLMTIENREERSRLAYAVVQVMGQLNPHLANVADYRHKLWDHLFIISGFKLDVDSPYPIPEPQQFNRKPEKVPYGHTRIKIRFYGKGIEMLIKKCGDMEDGDSKKAFANSIGNFMKSMQKTRNDENCTEEDLMKQLVELSGGAIPYYPDLTFTFIEQGGNPRLQPYFNKPNNGGSSKKGGFQNRNNRNGNFNKNRNKNNG